MQFQVADEIFRVAVDPPKHIMGDNNQLTSVLQDFEQPRVGMGYENPLSKNSLPFQKEIRVINDLAGSRENLEVLINNGKYALSENHPALEDVEVMLFDKLYQTHTDIEKRLGLSKEQTLSYTPQDSDKFLPSVEAQLSAMKQEDEAFYRETASGMSR